MAKVFTAPEYFGYQSGMNKLFIAGGITGASDWQTPVLRRLETEFDGYIYNPRRPVDFDLHDDDMSKEQISWEHEALATSNIILFWFPKNALCRITMFELGKELGKNTADLWVGVDPEFDRHFDVKYQCQLEGQVIYNDLDEMVTDLIACYKN